MVIFLLLVIATILLIANYKAIGSFIWGCFVMICMVGICYACYSFFKNNYIHIIRFLFIIGTFFGAVYFVNKNILHDTSMYDDLKKDIKESKDKVKKSVVDFAKEIDENSEKKKGEK